MNHHTAIVTRTYPELLSTTALAFDQHPAAVYLFSLGSERSRKVMAQALRTVASLLTGVDAREADLLALDWAALRYVHRGKGSEGAVGEP